MEKHLKGLSARTLLDVGPGYSPFGLLAARLTGATEITMLDCDLKVLAAQATKYIEAGRTAVSVRNFLSAGAIGRLTGTFDLILCQEVLEHLADAEKVLAALANKLTADGRIVITVPTKFSERWLKRINASYMKNEENGHVRQFDRKALLAALEASQLAPLVFVSTQPHYLLGHTWLFGTRMKVEGSSCKVITGGLRGFVFGRLVRWSFRFFMLTGPEPWGRLLPRNYFLVAQKRSA
jgi:SAM-dependent methyltransferase